jgi:hypothetical protein
MKETWLPTCSSLAVLSSWGGPTLAGEPGAVRNQEAASGINLGRATPDFV